MNAVKYIRVSTKDQNIARQTIKNTPDGITVLEVVDKCSGTILFNKRDNAPKVLKMAKEGSIDTLLVHSIDRLGRNTLDILQTIQEFTNLGINVKSEKEGLETLIDGKENPIAKLMINIMATLSEFERERILERQSEGIQRAKVRGVYKTNGGNKEPLSLDAFFNKEKNAKCLKELKRGESLRRAASLSGVSLGTAQKVSKLAIETGKL
ncbi:recombinase family protein [Flavobacteriaceae bacterium]|nr:recombinase family protein [Flavobacteriaceae bacterium]